MKKSVFREPHIRRKAVHLAFVVVIVASFAWMLVQPSRFFLAYETPEAVYWHQYRVEPEILVMGENSVLMLHAGEEKAKQYYAIARKSKRGWENSSELDRESSLWGFSSDSGFYVLVNRLKGTQEYYVGVFSKFDEEFEVSDNRKSQFILYDIVSTESGFDMVETDRGTRGYAYVPALDDDYEIRINGEIITLMKE